jgi:integrase
VAIRKIEKRVLPSGKVVFRAPYTDGSGQRRSQNFGTAKEAKEFLLTVGDELRRGTHVASSTSPTILEAAQFWIARCERKGLESKTLDQYRQHVDLHIVPAVGNRKLSQMTSAAAITAFVDQLHQAGRSPKMIKKVMISLGGIFREARRRGLAVTIPTQDLDLDLPERDDPRAVIPSKAELQRIIAGAKGRWRAPILVAIFCGLRASELRGLFWIDVDLEGGLIHVQRRADDSHRLGKLKSASGYRAIPLPPIVVNALREWKLACPKGELVFPNKIGKVESYANLMQRGFGPIQIAAGITKQRDGRTVARYGLHALRHACASLWIESNFNAKQLQKLMGHSSIKVTFDVYGHLFKDAEADQRAAASVQLRLLGS